MSQETLNWLNNNVLVGFTEKRGTAWHYKASEQGDVPNHFEGAIPMAAVIDRLFFWSAIKAPLFVGLPATVETATSMDEEGNPTRISAAEGHYAIVREDTGAIFGLFKEGYQIHQYKEWLLQKVSQLLGDSLAIGSAGLLKNGGRAWVSIETPDTLTTAQGVQYRPNLLAATSHDGSLSSTYKPVITNVVCDNTLAFGLGEKTAAIKVKHSKYSNLKLSDARATLGILELAADAFEAEVAELTAATVTDRQWAKFLDTIAPVPEAEGRGKTLAENKRSAIDGLWKHDLRVAPWAGTAWGALQAVNTYTHHLANVRGGERVERNAERAILGGIDRVDAETVDALRLVGVGV